MWIEPSVLPKKVWEKVFQRVRKIPNILENIEAQIYVISWFINFYNQYSCNSALFIFLP